MVAHQNHSNIVAGSQAPPLIRGQTTTQLNNRPQPPAYRPPVAAPPHLSKAAAAAGAGPSRTADTKGKGCGWNNGHILVPLRSSGWFVFRRRPTAAS